MLVLGKKCVWYFYSFVNYDCIVDKCGTSYGSRKFKKNKNLKLSEHNNTSCNNATCHATSKHPSGPLMYGATVVIGKLEL